jgi:transcriptional activator SPT7
MDFQTMLKKVKQKQYKSKKEFKDDLDLIWSNCFQYNAADVRRLSSHPSPLRDANTQNHPLRLCATRLKAKAEHLLKYITDRKERADPSVPVDLSVPSSGRRAPSHPPTKLNGINGHIHTLSLLPSRPPSSNDSRTGHRLTPAWTPPRRVRGQSFEESPAIVRTAEGMAAIFELEQSLDALLSAPGPSSHADALDALLRSHIGESDSDADDGADSDAEGIVLDGATGDKRKLFVFTRASAIDSILIISSQKRHT